MGNKFGAIKTKVGDVTFDSRKEARRYQELLLLERAGVIDGIVLQPTYEIVINGNKVCKIKLDFEYFDKERNCYVTEDVKGGTATRTPVSRLKHKLLFAVHGVTVIYV